MSHFFYQVGIWCLCYTSLGRKTKTNSAPETSLFSQIMNSKLLQGDKLPPQYKITHYFYLVINNKQDISHITLLLEYPIYIVSFRKAIEERIVMMADGENKTLLMNKLLDNYIHYGTKAVSFHFKYLVVMHFLRKKQKIFHYKKYQLASQYFKEIVYETTHVPKNIIEQLYNLYEFDLYQRFIFLIGQHNLVKAEETALLIERIHNDKQVHHLIKRLKFLADTKHVPKVFCTLEEIHWFLKENYTGSHLQAQDIGNIIIDHQWLFTRYRDKNYSKIKHNIIMIIYKVFPSLIISEYSHIEKLLFSDWVQVNEESVHIISYLRGLYFFYKGNYLNALRCFQQALGKHQTIKERAKYLFWIANSYQALGERQKAYQTYHEVSELYIAYYSTMSNYIINKNIYCRSVYHLVPDMKEHVNDWYFYTLELLSTADEKDIFNKYISFVHNINVNLLFQVTNTTVAVLKKMTTLANHGYITILGDKIREKTGLIILESYMIPNWKYLDTYSKEFQLIMYSLLRKESYGRYTCYLSSTKNARGVMQIRESTAKTLCERNHIPYSSHRLTHDNEYNIQIGAKCLGELLKIFKQSIVLTVAAYNVGSPKVLKWKKIIYPTLEKNPMSDQNSQWEKDLLKSLIFIELIPFTETKYYVKEVLDNLIIIMQLQGVRIVIN